METISLLEKTEQSTQTNANYLVFFLVTAASYEDPNQII